MHKGGTWGPGTRETKNSWVQSTWIAAKALVVDNKQGLCGR